MKYRTSIPLEKSYDESKSSINWRYVELALHRDSWNENKYIVQTVQPIQPELLMIRIRVDSNPFDRTDESVNDLSIIFYTFRFFGL